MFDSIFHNIKKRSITTRMIMSFSLLLLIQMVIIGWFSYSWISDYQKDTNINYMQVTNNGLMQQINSIRHNFENQSERILNNQTIQDILIKNNDTVPSHSELYRDLSIVRNLLFDTKETYFVIIVQRNGIIYQPYSSKYIGITHGQIKNTKAYLNSLENFGSTWIAVNENMMTQKEEPFLYLTTTLKALMIRQKEIGKLLIQIPMDSLSDIFKTSNLKNGEYYAIIDNNGNYLYNSEKMTLIGEKADEGILSITKSQKEGWQIIHQNDDDYLISYSNYPGDGWNVIHVLPMSYISANAESVRNYVLLILFISLLILLPLLILMSRSLSSPIIKLKATVEKFGSGHLSTREKTSGRMDEIGNLQTSFNKMADDITGLLSIINDEHKQRRLLEFNILEYQINPHFLYNSLDSIHWMAKVSGSKDIEDMVCALAKYLRIGLSKGKEVFEVRNELEHVRQYLLINTIRFKDCFNFEIQAEPEILNCKTIKIILQPIVENAIKYGINKKNTNGFIKITAWSEGQSILFAVSDNGPGISIEKIKAIHNLLSDHTIESESENGYGFYNVNQRIWLHYGEGYGINIEESSSLGMGTTVKIRIPLIKT